MSMTLENEQLHIEAYLSASDGTYNPYVNIYDSKTATVLYLPRGVYVDLAEMQLMYDAGKIPSFVSYENFIDTDAPYEKAKPQIIVFIAEAQIHPLYWNRIRRMVAHRRWMWTSPFRFTSDLRFRIKPTQ